MNRKLINSFLGMSLYYKLFAVYGITFFVIISSLTFITKISGQKIQKAEKAELQQFSQYLAKDIGIPPNLEKAKKITQSFNLYLKITGPNTNWGQLEQEFSAPKEMVTIREGDYTFTFIRKKAPIQYTLWETIGVFFIVIPLLLLGSNLIVRYLLSPLKNLVRGTQEISAGNFDIDLPIESSDELGDLTENFNRMSLKIKDQLNDMQTLLVGIAHEFKTPLTRIKLQLEKLDDVKLKNEISGELDLVSNMTTMILDQHRLNERPDLLNLLPVDLNLFLTKFCESKDMEFATMNSEVLVDIDTDRFKLLLSNLYQNAQKYGKPPISLKLQTHASKAILIFEDTGSGLSREIIENLSKPFYRGDQSRSKDQEGFGLGLSLVVSIIKAHKGQCFFELTSTQGLRVKIHLPLISL